MTEREESWLLEEYKLLSAHYFHEDQVYFRMGGLLITLNGALIAFSATSAGVPRLPVVMVVLFAAFGFALTLGWIAMLWRIRAVRQVASNRIAEIEAALESTWTAAVPSPRIRLRLQERMAGLSRRLPSRLVASVPATVLFLMVPVVAAAYWVCLPFWR
ncbi:hypothetical protein SK571_05540 [Lentzea sp. BCCO 10_0798]|uniref:Uncharacterized protein n=1 Tax=Lentzea kristufekii TaxID=3095430 RepID=A0ABU4TKM2_9PSEU|nr:hypothetical protein [Lentzea sp. BCCO 10_0798]MDX8048834.1 hypothetical protein [Lentzea sp. BCCO 10_0798]